MTIPKVSLPPFVEKIGDGHLAHSQNENLHTLGKDTLKALDLDKDDAQLKAEE